MTLNTLWTDWRKVGPAGNYRTCSPNLLAIRGALEGRGWSRLGCLNPRPVRGGTVASIHTWAAQDLRHPDTDERRLIIDWMIDNSLELGISEIHDYFGLGYCGTGRVGTRGVVDLGGYWKAGRGWRAAGGPNAQGLWVSGDPAMHKAYALWVHMETTQTEWANSTPVETRGILMPGETAPVAEPKLWDLVKFTPADQRPWLGHPNVQADGVEVGGIQTRHWLQYFREVAVHKAGQVTGDYGSPWDIRDIAALRAIAAYFQRPGAADLMHLDSATWALIAWVAG